MNLPYKYSYLGKTFLMTIFFLPLLPIGAIISLVGVILLYFIEKYNTISFYKIPAKINSTITLGHLESFKVFILVYAISIYVFQRDVYNTYFNFSLFSLIFFAAISILPFSKLFEIDFIQFNQEYHYEEEYLDFFSNYDTLNPVTKRKGKLNYLNKLKKKNIIKLKDYIAVKEKIINGEFVYIFELYRQRVVKKNNKIRVQNIIKQAVFSGFNKKNEISKDNLMSDINKEELNQIKQSAKKALIGKEDILNIFAGSKIEKEKDSFADEQGRNNFISSNKEKIENITNLFGVKMKSNEDESKEKEAKEKQGISNLLGSISNTNNNMNNSKINELNEMMVSNEEKKENLIVNENKD